MAYSLVVLVLAAKMLEFAIDSDKSVFAMFVLGGHSFK